MSILKRIATAVYILVLICVFAFGLLNAVNNQTLIPFAFPAALVLLLAARAFGPKAELASWSVFTVLLGSAYVLLVTAWAGIFPIEKITIVEVIALIACFGFGLLGAFKSPYFLAFAWLFYPVLAFFHPKLPFDVLEDFAAACVLFGLPIGLYIFWFAYKNRWTVFSLKLMPKNLRGIA